MNWATSLWAPLEVALNQILDLDPDASAKLKPMAGKIIAIELKGFNLTLTLRIAEQSIHILGDFKGEPDTRLVGSPIGLARLGLQRGTQQATGLFEGDVEFYGDLETGRRFKSFMDNIDIDWEEQLSHVTGDVVAHQLGHVSREAFAWGRGVLNTLAQDSVEYLQEESHDLPPQAEVSTFLVNVDTLRAQVDRLAARVHRLSEPLQTDKAAKE
ncbi:MAG: sterol-binding protein [Gammaproteobacteria bacterium]|nr:sterol-binding protein [Gammaproteobacteria bacterium]